MNQPKQIRLLPLLAIASVLAVLSGLVTQLCRIGHGPIAPVAVIAPYAALLILAGFDVLPVWVAALQFPVYALGLAFTHPRSLVATSVAVLIVHCIAIVITFACIF